MSIGDDTQMEFHISRKARDHYQFDLSLYSLNGNVILSDFHIVRLFAQRLNQKRDLVHYPEQAVKASQINAMGLIDEILHIVIRLYQRQRVTNAMRLAVEWLEAEIGKEELDRTLKVFLEQFPPLRIYKREIDANSYLSSETNGISNREIALEEMLVLWLANVNPAFSPFLELFDDEELERRTAYPEIIAELKKFFDTQPGFGPDNQSLVDLLRSPAVAVPHSLAGQLEYIRKHWGYMLGDYLLQLLRGLDLIEEEEKAIFGGTGPAIVYDFGGLDVEEERFSPDKDWMPSIVMLAKNAYVWLDQLSKKYASQIKRLDQIPDEELKTLSDWGFSALWLIGLWERSQASRTIKQIRGNPDAVASAYSLFDYQIADDLGGEDAYQNLRDRAWNFGIRLASDMVPNHMGIDSRWLVDHPDWFISLDYSPFPSYSYNGPNLSWDDRVGIYLEDHYYDGSDAAVVFNRRDQWTGDSRFIYHGNDGTSMPWNDTAQLDYLKPEVREAVIQTILHVARKFPIIRFDAAMTLAKKHYQRLWYPEPGTGGAIPSRAEHGLTKAQFDAAMPVEFWREVVDRVAVEVPDTLLLAEAFWLMEGYFVRTLGMHRVYNSAFMNMLRDEKNQDYRLVIKNTLEFDPEILKRYVNFMNNPDERTAVDQFGKDDKYFGICIMLATMPGLPMFGHGQIEGYSEKYGMEFRRAYWEEEPDQYLVERHVREIFPLLQKRYLFAGVENFLLYDFYSSEGFVNEDVFAYSNRVGEERVLVVYHNIYAEARGWIHSSAAFIDKSNRNDGGTSERLLKQSSLGEGLNLHNDERYFTVFRDHISGLEYIRSSKLIFDKGLYVELGAYNYNVFWNFYELQDNEWHHYAQLVDYLQGRGVIDIQSTLKEIFLQPINNAYRELVNPGMFTYLFNSRIDTLEEMVAPEALDEVEQKSRLLLREVQNFIKEGDGDQLIDEVALEIKSKVESILALPVIIDRYLPMYSDQFLKFLERNEDINQQELFIWRVLFGWAFTHALGKITGDENAAEFSRSWMDEWLLGKIILQTLNELDFEEGVSSRAAATIKWLTTHQDWMRIKAFEGNRAYNVLLSFLNDMEIHQYLFINRYQDILWFNRESFEDLLDWMMIISVLINSTNPNIDEDEISKLILNDYEMIQFLKMVGEDSKFQLDRLIEGTKVKV